MELKRAAGPRSIRELRQRLQEAEDTLAAIRDGQVDALVVRGPDGEQIYTLRSADHPYRLMVEQMREGALTLSHDGIVLYCNDRLGELAGLPADEVVGLQFRTFLAPGDIPTFEAMLGGAQAREECRLVARNGVERHVQLSSSALAIDGVRTVAMVVTDLTHERTERALRESNRLKDLFLATLSHELRTPLNVILGWTQILSGHDLAPAARAHALALIQRNAQAQARLVDDLVDVSRIVTGKVHLDLEPLAVGPLLEAGVEAARTMSREKHIAIDKSWSLDGACVRGDATRLQQVLWNLLSNAVKFTPAGGRVTVRATAASGTLRLEVIDTGIGLQPEFLPHIFDRFSQAESAKTRRFGGLGLGLSIVRDLVRMHGGEVSAHSDGVGHGATFVVTLPLVPEDARPARPAPPASAGSLAGQRVMLVEDHEDSRELLGHALRTAGAEVAEFRTATAAFDALDTVRPTAIVADIGLPGEDGYSFIRRVRAHGHAPTRSVPAVAVTAYASAPDRAAALAAGFHRHLAKPVDPVQLAEVLHALVHASR